MSDPKTVTAVSNIEVNAAAPETQVFSTTAAEQVDIAAQERLPEDQLSDMSDNSLLLEKRDEVDPDSLLSPPSRPHIDRKQRANLDQQIEALYHRVATELSDHPQDVAYALDKLREAQDIVLGDTERSEEALYWIFVVNQMLVKKHNLRRWSYTWGMAAFFYAVFWLALLMYGFIAQLPTLATGSPTIWFAALAGGIGGVVTILYELSWHVSVRKDFDRQYMMKYLAHPVMGFVLGAVVYLITSAGFIALGAATGSADSLADSVLAVQVLLGFVAGFRQQIVYDMVDTILKRFSSSNNAPNQGIS